MLARFSTVAGESGSPDTWRDPRGFALKFYTPEGNYDMVGNNTPIFFVRDPMKFQHFIRSQKRRADNGLRDHDMQWDFWTLSPESAHQVTWLMGDRGIPKTWRHMNGYTSHTYMWVNAAGEKFWVKYHFKTDQGVECLTQEEADKLAGESPDYHRQDLFEAIRDGEFPSWTLQGPDHAVRGGQDLPLQPVRPDQGVAARRLPADRGRHDDAQPQPDRLPHRDGAGGVRAQQPRPGIGLSPDKMLLARGFSYADAHRARLGVNYKQIPVNAPTAPVHSYSKDGVDADGQRHRSRSTRRTPTAVRQADPSRTDEAGLWVGRRRDGPRRRTRRAPTTTTSSRRGRMVREVLDDEARERLVGNVAGHLADGVSDAVLARAFEYWKNIDPRDRRADRAGRRRHRRRLTPSIVTRGGPAVRGAAPAVTPRPRRPRSGSLVTGWQALDGLGEPLQRLDDVLAVGLLVHGQPHGGDLPGQVLGLGQRPGVGVAVALDLLALTVGLAVLGQQDQRGGVRGLGREGEVEQDERVRVEAQRDRGDVEHDPDDDEDRLPDDVARGPEEPGQPLGQRPERIRVIDRAAGRARGAC